MPRINNLPDDTTINDNDKLIGTDSQTGASRNYRTVSYTHLTLPTILLV